MNSRSHTVYSTLREMILTGVIYPGESMEEVRIANELKVSRTPVRSALQMLEADGLVTAARNKSVNVRIVGKDEFREITQARLILEPAVFCEAAAQIPREELISLRYKFARFIEGRREDKGYIDTLDYRFHSLFADSCGNFLFRKLIRQVHDLMQLLRKQTNPSWADKYEDAEEHIAIINAILDEADCDELSRLVVHHIQSGERKSLPLLE